MQKPIAYYLLLFYAASVCKPLTIWLADVFAHNAFEHQHMAGVHHIEGKAHVHYQIGKAAKDDAPEQKTTSPKADDEITMTSFAQSLSRLDRFIAATHFSFTDTNLPAVFLPVPLPPPWPRFARQIIG